MIFGSKNKQGNIAVNLGFKSGVEAYEKISKLGTPAAVELSIDRDNSVLTTVQRVFKDLPKININFNSIVDYEIISEKEILEKSKSIAGRAVVGGLLLGPVGAIVGGISGTGKNKKNIYENFFVINYKSESGEIKSIVYQVMPATYHLGKFIKELDSLNLKPKKEKVTEINL